MNLFKKIVLLGTLATMGCGGPMPVSLKSFDGAGAVTTDPSPEIREVLDEGFGAWGLTYELLSFEETWGGYGAIDLIIVTPTDPSTETRGGHLKPTLCRHRIWVEAEGHLLAHELGHAWGLDDLDDSHSDNLMHWRGAGEDITEEQWDDAQVKIDLFRACVDGG